MYQTRQQRKRIDGLLSSLGLGALDQPMRLCGELAAYVRDHDHFRLLLMACEPQERANMFDAMRGNLRFRPRTLDAYIAEAGAIAEAKQLPLQDADGNLHPFMPPVIESQAQRDSRAFIDAQNELDQADLANATAAVNEARANARLLLTCRKCTRQEVFASDTKANAVFAAREAGWTYDELNGTGAEICPSCP